MIAFWMGLPPWMRTALMWAGALMMAFLTGKFILVQHDNRIRSEVNTKRDADAARVESQIIATITENSNEYVRASDAVRSHTVAEQLPDGKGASLPPHHYRD